MLRKRGNVWWVRFKHLGQIVELSTGKTDRRQATRRAQEIEVEHRRMNPAESVRGEATLLELASWDIARALAAGAGPTRESELRGRWRRLFEFFGETTRARDIDGAKLQEYVLVRRGAGVRGQTIVREVDSMRRGLSIAVRRGCAAAVPEAPKLRLDPPKETARGKLHPVEVISAVADRLDLGARAVVALAAATGMRKTEIARFRLDWVVPAAPGAPVPWLIRLPASATKTRKERVVGLRADVHALLIQCAQSQGSWDNSYGGFLPVRNIDRALRSASRAIGYDRTVTLRDCRHTFATLALQASGDQWAVLSAMGHTDLRMTSVYQSTTSARAALVASVIPVVGTVEGGQYHKKTVSNGFSQHGCRRQGPANLDNPAILRDQTVICGDRLADSWTEEGGQRGGTVVRGCRSTRWRKGLRGLRALALIAVMSGCGDRCWRDATAESALGLCVYDPEGLGDVAAIAAVARSVQRVTGLGNVETMWDGVDVYLQPDMVPYPWVSEHGYSEVYGWADCVEVHVAWFPGRCARETALAHELAHVAQCHRTLSEIDIEPDAEAVAEQVAEDPVVQGADPC